MSTVPRHDPQVGMFLATAMLLVGFGVLMVHSASITSWPTEFERVYLSRHLIFLAIGGLAATCAALLPERFWYRAAPFLFIGTLILLALVLIPGVGTKVNGARRWFRYGPVSLQPSELVKITLPLVMARLLVNRRQSLRKWIAGTVPFAIPIALALPLILMEPDLGTSLFLCTGAAVLLFVGGWPIRNFLIGMFLAVPAIVTMVTLKPYQMKRITGFLAVWTDLNEAPYQLKQSLVTLGSGGLTGVGLGKGWQKLSFLPEANTDFVFAVVGEELGLIGTLGVVTVWAALFYSGVRLLRRLDRHSFAYVAGITLLAQLVVQAVINMAVVLALVPPKGIPHPLLSYGGTNLVVSLLSLGIIVSLSKADPDADAVYEAEILEETAGSSVD